ncbi:MAG TPA: metalloregulator ArsR/SmtB family transcription factor [Micromonosporaceae bacterium]
MTQSQPARPVHMTITDPKVMRAMAHPARVAILEYLTNGPEATATECAQVVGLSPSATSYHLRALAKVGLVQEAPSRGDGRERVWRGSISGYRIDTDDVTSPEALSAATALVDVVLSRDDRLAREFLEHANEEPREWYDAAGLTRNQLLMTAQELADLHEQVAQLMKPYHRSTRTDPPLGARRVTAMFRAFPAD